MRENNLDKTLKKIKNIKTIKRGPRDLIQNLEERLSAVQDEVNKKIRDRRNRHYGFNEENS